MEKNVILRPFKHGFLSQFTLAPQVLPFTDQEIIEFDKKLVEYEQTYLNPDVEKNLISKNELLASFAISKAENSTLLLAEAQDVYDSILNDPNYDFITDKLKNKNKLTQKDHDKLEFFNIAKAFKQLNANKFSVHDLTPEFIKQTHRLLTKGMDIFKSQLADFTVYKSGQWRDNDLIHVGNYVPASFITIENGVDEIIQWIKDHPTPSGIAILHTSLYGLHPFNNGNKRVCRILEHLLLRAIEINNKNLYSTSFYYHKQKDRYYKNLLYSLERKNLNHFVSFILEAISISIISVLKTSIETKRLEFITKSNLDQSIKEIAKPLVKRKELQFKNLYNKVKNKMARQTFVNYLSQSNDSKVTLKREFGRSVYYRLACNFPEEQTFNQWLVLIKQRLSYIPDDIKLL